MTTPDQVLERIALTDVIVDINVRTDIKLDKSFVSSIRNHGILQPPIGWRGEDGKVRITAGQRRTLAAMELELTEIDVIIKPQEIAEAARIVTQLTENDQRQELTDSERLFGYKQLAMFGVSADQIARKTNKPKAHVVQALAVAESDVATDALAAYPIDLEQAALLVEFENDPPAIERLTDVAQTSPSSLVHEAQRIRDQRAFEKAKAEVEEQLRVDGWEILEARPSWEDKTINHVGSLWQADDPETKRLTVEDAAAYEGRCAVVGQAGYHEQQEGQLTSTSYYIRGFREQGLTTWDSGSTRGPLTDEEKAARKIERQTSADLKSATTVRRAWLRDTLLADRAKIDVSTAVGRIATAFLGLDTSASDGKVYAIAAELLDIDCEPAPNSYSSPARTAVLDVLRTGGDPLRIALGVAIARTESAVGDPTWKSAREDHRTVEYYLQLQAWGYTLSDIEQQIVKKGGKR